MKKLIKPFLAALALASITHADPASQPAVAPPPAVVPPPPVVPPPAQIQAAQSPAEWRKKQKEDARKSVSAMKVVGKYKLSDLIHFSSKNGLFQVEWVGDVNFPDFARIEIEGSAAIWTIRSRTVRQLNGVTTSEVNINRYDLDRADDAGPFEIGFNVNNNYMALNALYGPGSPISTLNYQEVGKSVLMTWNVVQNNKFIQGGSVSGGTIFQLKSRNPHEVRKFLTPVLVDLTGAQWLRPGAADLYRAFDQIPADPKVAHQVDDIIIRLDAADVADRDKASADLRALGIPAVIAALRVDTQPLSAEQRARIDAFLADYTQRTFDSPAAARQDIPFLFDAMEDSDINVRKAAKACIESLTHQPLDVDVTLSGDKLMDAIDAARAQVTNLGTTQPSLDAQHINGTAIAPE